MPEYEHICVKLKSWNLLMVCNYFRTSDMIFDVCIYLRGKIGVSLLLI